MKSLQIKGIVLLALIMLVAFAVKSVLPKEAKSPYLKQIEEEEEAKNLRWYGAVNRYAVIAVPSALLLTLIIGVSCWGRAAIKRASVHVYKIAENEVVVHERDLSIAAPIAMGLMNAEQLKQMNGGIDKAFELYERMADIQTHHFKALSSGKPLALQAMSDTRADQHTTQDTPSFRRLLESGAIKEGNPMILGFEQGKPRPGSFLDIYSAAVAGESGSGKTSTMLFLIASGLISMGVRFVGIDPHYPHPKSLGFKTRPLWEKGLMEMATNYVAMQDVLQEVESLIDARLSQADTDETPVVLVIDELAFLSKTSIGPAVAHTMERISTEGRKCAVYMLASSQTWLAARTGNSSVVRDTLTSAYVHRIKPKQANLLLQDKDEAEKVKKHIKQPGEVLLCPVNDDSVVCQMPYTTEEDMVRVANMLEPVIIGQHSGQYEVNTPVNVDRHVDLALTSEIRDVDLIERVKTRIRKQGDQGRMADRLGYDRGLFSKVLAGKKSLPPELREKMMREVKPADVIPLRTR